MRFEKPDITRKRIFCYNFCLPLSKIRKVFEITDGKLYEWPKVQLLKYFLYKIKGKFTILRKLEILLQERAAQSMKMKKFFGAYKL